MLEIQNFSSKIFSRHLILDRDSTLIADSGYTHQTNDLIFLSGALEALSLAKKMNLTVSIATNQSGVGRGFFSREQLIKFNCNLANHILRRTGLELSWILSCTHVEADDCFCRKPKPGMLLELIKLSNIPMKKTAFFGNSDSDLNAGMKAGIYSRISFGPNLYGSIMEWGKSLDSN